MLTNKILGIELLEVKLNPLPYQIAKSRQEAFRIPEPMPQQCICLYNILLWAILTVSYKVFGS